MIYNYTELSRKFSPSEKYNKNNAKKLIIFIQKLIKAIEELHGEYFGLPINSTTLKIRRQYQNLFKEYNTLYKL